MGILSGNWLPDDPDKNAAARQGLLAFAGAMMNNRGGLLSGAGNGLVAAGSEYNNSLTQQQQQQQQQALRDAQLKQVGLENQKLEAGISKPGSIASILSRNRAPTTPPPGQPGAVSRASSPSQLPQLAEGTAPSAPAAPSAPQSLSPEYLFNYYRQRGDALADEGYMDEAKDQYAFAEKQKRELMKRETLTQNGRPVSVLTYKDGGEVASSFDALPDNKVVDLGGTQTVVDMNQGMNGKQFTKTVTPGERLSADTTRRGQDLSHGDSVESRNQQDRIATQGRTPVGYRWSADGKTLEAIPGGPVMSKTTEQQQKVNDAQSVVDLIGTARPLIEKATHSYIGIAADHAARAFGASTEGSQASAQLRALEGNLVSKMPKMSGPQSDKDVLLYKQMAGQIGDPTVPPKDKLAAMKVIEEINQRYLDGAPPKAVTPKVTPLDKVPKIAPGAPAVGTVKSGYRFKGGNPADKANWEKQ